MIVDKHIHTPFCPHGSNEPMEQYVKSAIEKGISEITFTEHAPLPIEDPAPNKDSAMREEDVYAYLKEVKGLQARYGHKIAIHAGFEVDYIEGYEEATRLFLEKHPETIPHSILSVHFIRLADDTFFCVDFSKDSFIKKGEEIGYHTLYQLYASAIEKALSEPYGELTPKKIGHINLIHKFKKAYDFKDPINWEKVLENVQVSGYRMDYNFAGIDKKFYGKTYPEKDLTEKAKAWGIELETGSDAHRPEEVGRYFT